MLYRKLFYLSHLLCKIFIVFRCVHYYRACVKLNSAHDILEDFRHNNKPGLLPGWTRKDIEQLTYFLYLRVEMLNVLYVVEAFRHDYMPGLLSGWTRKDIEQLPIFFIYFFLRIEMLTCYISCKRSAIIILQDFYPNEPEMISEQLPNFFLWVEMLKVL